MAGAPLPDYRYAALAHQRGEDVTSPRPLRLTIEDLELLHGVWSRDDRYHSTKLIDGRIFHTPARHAQRGSLAMELFMRLRQALEALDSPFACAIPGSIAMPPYDLPLPDLVLTDDDLRRPGFIAVASVPLVIEVGDTAMDFFLGEKLRLYARHAVPEYWVADVNKRVIHQLWAPAGEAYAERREAAFGELVEAATVAALVIETKGL